jgi:hypothetical protein
MAIREPDEAGSTDRSVSKMSDELIVRATVLSNGGDFGEGVRSDIATNSTT